MGILEKALWYIEYSRSEVLQLQDIAEVCGVSRFHLSRLFQGTLGQPVMAYVRARRLSEAACLLAEGAPDILTVALDSGYGSHEAFTRAFRLQFGTSPDAVRSARSTENLQLEEPFAMDASYLTDLQPPRFEERDRFHVAGVSGYYTFETNLGIPALWRRFQPHIGHIPGQVGTIAYGVCSNGDGKGAFDYMACIEVARPEEVPKDLACQTIPAQRYAVFTHAGHISDIRKTVYSIWNKWLPEADVASAEGPDFELYDARFDPETGQGEVEIWIPVT